MAAQFSTIPLIDFGAGIDQQSAENALSEGFLEDCLNFDPQDEGYIKKRAGYQAYAGFLPIRISRIEYTDDATNNICVYFDGSVDISSVDLSTIRSTPVIIQGRTSSAQSGDFTSTDSAHYYSGFTASIKKQFNAGLNQNLVIPGTEHGQGTDKLVVRAAESTSLVNNSNDMIEINSVVIDSTTFDITINYDSASAFDGFVLISKKVTTPGSVYHASWTGGGVSVPAATHGLSNFNIMCEIYQIVGGTLEKVEADSVTISPAGQVDITLSFSIDSFIAILSTVPVSNFVTGTVGASSTATVVVPVAKPFVRIEPYLENPTGSGTYELVGADSVVVDETAGTATVEFVNNTTSPTSFTLFYEEVPMASNKLCVTGSAITTPQQYTDSRPQLVLWGLDHASLYGATEGRPGWVNHIDSYRSSGSSRVVSGLGGNLFDVRGRTEVGSDFLLPILYPSIRGRVNTSLNLGPVFVDTADSSNRTRGYIKADGAAEGWLTAQSITYNSGTGFTDYVVSVPNVAVSGTLSTIISTSSGLEDYLTIEQAGYSENQGLFKIRATSLIGNLLTISVENSARDSADFDETDCGARAGIFSEQIGLSATALFLPQDILTSDSFSDYQVLSASGSTVVVSSVVELTAIPGGLRIAGSRTSSVIPLRKLDDTRSVENLVAGDMLRITAFNRLFKVRYINPLADMAATLVGDGTELEVTVSSTNHLNEGQAILLSQAGDFSGEVTISEIVSPTVFKCLSSVSGSGSGTILGKTVTVDESFALGDSVNSTVSLDVKERWIPIEAPDDSFSGTPSTYISHFTSGGYSNQEFLRSGMVADNLYLTNGSDPLSKYDGADVYRAGLIRWQPYLFVTTSPGASAKILVQSPSVATTGHSGNRINIALADKAVFTVGTLIKYTLDGLEYLIERIDSDATSAYLILDSNITVATAASTAARVVTYRYYFRLNAIDSNNNIIASAITGSEDCRVRLGVDAAINFRLVGLPAWDIYDYDKLEVQVYRTKKDLSAPFYLITTLPLSFNSGDKYINFTDTFSDYTLTNENLDTTSPLKGGELGVAWNRPLRARYMTTARNRLITANLVGDPTLDVRFIKSVLDITPSSLSDKVFLLRKDNTDTSIVSNGSDRQAFEFKTSGSLAIVIAARTDSTFDVTDTGHGLIAGNWVYLFHPAITSNASLQYAGWFQIATVLDTNTYRINHSNVGYTLATEVTRRIAATAPPAPPPDSVLTGAIPVWLGTDGNYASFNGNGLSGASAVSSTEPVEFLAVRRLANAINATQAMLSEPWMTAAAGGEFDSRQILITQPKSLSTTMELVLPSFSGFNIFVNSLKQSSAASVSAFTAIYPSRISASYSNYPELMDNQEAEVDSLSDSVVDVNPADGQEITGAISFFGDSAFGAAQKDDIIVVFKANSIYLVNLAAKVAGQNPVQKIESRGLGCTAPYSIAATRDGIMFANEAGVFKLTRSLQVDFAGMKLGRLWTSLVNKENLALSVGHQYPTLSQYKLSFPGGDAGATEANTDVFVYNHDREDKGTRGSWARYDNHPATGWTNLTNNAYMASSLGAVFQLRTLGESSDYRDDSSAIEAEATFRAMDFGDGGTRKLINSVILHFRNTGDVTGVALLSATDLSDNFLPADSFTIDFSPAVNGMGDTYGYKVKSLRFSLDNNKGLYLQLKLQDTAKDEGCELSRIDVKVAGLSQRGIPEAKG